MSGIILFAAVMAAAAPAAPPRTLVSEILGRCPEKNRVKFLNHVRFIGSRVVDLEFHSVSACLGEATKQEFVSEITRIGQESEAGGDGEPRALFPACPDSVRDAFYKSLVIKDGRLIKMKDRAIRRCGGGDIPRLLSLFGGLQSP